MDWTIDWGSVFSIFLKFAWEPGTSFLFAVELPPPDEVSAVNCLLMRTADVICYWDAVAILLPLVF